MAGNMDTVLPRFLDFPSFFFALSICRVRLRVCLECLNPGVVRDASFSGYQFVQGSLTDAWTPPWGHVVFAPLPPPHQNRYQNPLLLH